MVVYRTPGVFIEELPATGPIAGVGTSTAAFIGPALRGPTNTPVKVTNWTQFRGEFGDYNPAPRIYLPYAVRGFFENGGTLAYIVRVSTARRAFRDLNDRGLAPAPTLRVQAREDGPAGNAIQVAVQDAQIVAAGANARVRKVRAPINGAANDVITLTNLADAASFRPGDIVIVEGQAQRLTVTRVRGNELVVEPNLAVAAGAGFVRVADLAIGQRTFRVENGAGLEPGSVVRLAQAGAPNLAENVVVAGVAGEVVMLAGAGLTQAYGMAPADPVIGITSFEFNLVITSPPAAAENFLNLSMDPRHSRYFARIVTSSAVTVELSSPPSVQPPPDNRPAVVATTLANGAADSIPAIGLPHYQAALAALENVDDVNLLCMPDRTDTAAQAAVVDHCERMGDRFAILDADRGLPPFASLPTPSAISHRAAVESTRGYAALYYPWILINDPASLTGEETILVPPSGHLAGIYARSDAERGVHKAPANELIRGTVGLERRINDAEQGEINVVGVNGLRIFPGQARPIVWGARTTAPQEQTAWRYINVRRLFLFVEESLQEGLRWAVFEPNDLGLWKRLKRVITEFLTRVWRSGALFGATAEQAFYVKIDAELNPEPVRALGQVIIEIGLAPVRPAEFVVVRIGIWAGGADVSEG